MRVSGQKLDRIIREELQRELLTQGLITGRRDILQEGWFTDLLGGIWGWLSGLFDLEGTPSDKYQRAMQRIFKGMTQEEMKNLADMFNKLAESPRIGKLSIKQLLKLFESDSIFNALEQVKAQTGPLPPNIAAEGIIPRLVDILLEQDEEGDLLSKAKGLLADLKGGGNIDVSLGSDILNPVTTLGQTGPTRPTEDAKDDSDPQVDDILQNSDLVIEFATVAVTAGFDDKQKMLKFRRYLQNIVGDSELASLNVDQAGEAFQKMATAKKQQEEMDASGQAETIEQVKVDSEEAPDPDDAAVVPTAAQDEEVVQAVVDEAEDSPGVGTIDIPAPDADAQEIADWFASYVGEEPNKWEKIYPGKKYVGDLTSFKGKKITFNNAFGLARAAAKKKGVAPHMGLFTYKGRGKYTLYGTRKTGEG
jgi:hypothetical protein